MIDSRLKKELVVPSANISLITEKQLVPEDAIGIRGYLAGKFPEETLFHNHAPGGLIYSYPRVQYKILNGYACIICLAEGIAVTEKIQSITNVKLGNDFLKVIRINLESNESKIGISKSEQFYSFIAPWLGLNEDNYRKYLSSHKRERKILLERILIGNIISLCKGLGFTVPGDIIAKAQLEEVPAILKGNRMLGFIGNFSVNFQIPNLWGLGKSVSRGFGTIIKI
ncbi:MAG: CRISPR-associated endonuclease Cas6 [candidate division KSB1 bacterium]|nr:CRISPR-associated endonuclease Cas6 [candidate division KSB1 bacterium]MDZ7399618.1 CRISPR-associated endonuclease Cas6 [candidate division KSB1 bacterium]